MLFCIRCGDAAVRVHDKGRRYRCSGQILPRARPHLDVCKGIELGKAIAEFEFGTEEKIDE